MKIGELSRKTGCSVQTIRFYEREGLLAIPSRSEGNFRLYDDAYMHQLEFIKHCRSLDISLSEIKLMLEQRQFPQNSCASINAIIQTHLARVKVRIKELKNLQKTLTEMATSCSSEGDINNCGILKSLDASA